jgi:hypothetical protein
VVTVALDALGLSPGSAYSLTCLINGLEHFGLDRSLEAPLLGLVVQMHFVTKPAKKRLSKRIKGSQI